MTTRQVNGNRAVYAEKNGTNTWQIVIMAGAVMLTLASQFWTLANPRDDIRTTRLDLQASIDRQEKDLQGLIDKNQKRLEELTHQVDDHFSIIERRLQTDVVTIREHEEFVKREDARLNQLEQATAKIQDNVVTRAEHQTHWGEADQKFTNLGNRIDGLANQLISASSLGDQLKALQNQIDQLRVAQSGVHANVTLGPSTTLVPAPAASHN